MTIFILTIALFLLVTLAVIWTHYFRRSTADNANTNEHNSQRDDANISLYHEHKKEIEKDYANGGIDEENYQYLLVELEKSLLQDIAQNADEKDIAQKTVNSMSVLWPIAITFFIFAFSIGLYVQNSQYSLLDPMSAQRNAQHNSEQQSQKHESLDESQMIMVRIKTLQKKIETEPKNTEYWYELGQVLVGAGDFDNAIKAFDQIIEIEGVKADLLGAKAQATYYKNNQKIDANVQALIDQALALDPQDPSTNILLGMHNFIGNDYAEAIAYWERIIDSESQNGSNSVYISALTEAVNEAKNRLMMMGKKNSTNAQKQPVSEKHDHAHEHPESEHTINQAPVIIEGPQLSLNVSLSDNIFDLLTQGDDKVVFIYATPADGRRMPLAAVKIKASDLPIELILTDANAMSPQANLSSADTVNIYAVVSSTGAVGIKSGDYKAQALGIKVGKTDVTVLVVDTVVP
jgi:cytochrome c-type biogenesis protein CcmH